MINTDNNVSKEDIILIQSVANKISNSVSSAFSGQPETDKDEL